MARRGFQGAVLRGLGAREHDVTVTGSEPVTRHCVRVHMSAPTLFTDALAGPTAWLRFWFPDPSGTDAEYQRGYTIVDADVDAGTFSVDFVLHEPAGPASTWARAVEPGTTIQAVSLGSRPYEVPEEPPAGYLLVGDPASLPAIRSLLEAIPAEIPVEVYLEQHDADDPLLPLVEHPSATVRWIARKNAASLAEAIEDRDWSDWYAWAGLESGALKHVRSLLRNTFGFPKSEMHLQAYWMEGRAMGKRRGDSEPVPDAVGAGGSVPGAASVDGPASGAALPGSETDVAPAASATAADPANTSAPVAPAASTTSEVPVPAPEAPEPGGGPEPGGEPDPSSEPEPSSGPLPGPAPQRRRGRWRAGAGSRLLAPLKPVFITAGILQGLITVLQLVPYLLLVELARTLLAGDPDGRATALGIAVVVVLGVGTTLEMLLLLGLHAIDARFSRDLRSRLLDKLARLPLGWFTARGSGRTTSLVRDDTLSLHYLITHAVPDAVAAVVAPVAVLIYLFTVDWRLGLVLFVPVLVHVLTMYSMVVQSAAKTPVAHQWAERMTGESAAYLEAQPVVRVFGGAAASSFRNRLDEYVSFLNGWQRPFIAKKSLMDLVTRPTTFLFLISAVGTALVLGGGLDPIDLLPFLLLGTTFGARLLGIGFGLSGLRQGLLAARTLQNTLDERELVRQTGQVPIEPGEGVRSEDGALTEEGTLAEDGARTGRVEVDRARFSYRPGVPVIHDVSLTLEPGTLTALVGPSGSGKSTLAGLLARFHDLDAGAIHIDGRDIRSLDSDELYSRVGFVFQDVELVRGTMRENIALAVPDASDTEVEAAARAAHLHDRITALPKGYDSVLGEDTGLSGGELQRLSIARTMLADPPVLILDEATAFADPEAEYLVQRALSELAAGRTVLVIAHRLHTVTEADRIVVLDGGRIVESGTHAELLVAGGRYRQLWDSGTGAPAVPEIGAQGPGSPEPTTTESGSTEARSNQEVPR